MSLHVATCAYSLEPLADFAAFADKQARLVHEAAHAGAQLLVFPEYASMELTSTLPDAQRGALSRELSAMSSLLAPMLALYGELARKNDVYILSPSFPERLSSNHGYANRARLHAPNGRCELTEKLQLAHYESETWGVCAGSTARVFETELGVVGVALCYDAEFPLLVRRQVVAGADLVLVPSSSDTLAGYHRVSLSCRARALENQCFTVHAVTVGDAPWSIALDRNVGAAGVYGPIEQELCPDGVIALGRLNESGWVYADVDLGAASRARREGPVRNHRDWDLPAHLQGPIERVSL